MAYSQTNKIDKGVDMESTTSSAALIKFLLSHTGAAIVAACIGFLFVPPHTVREAIVRLVATLLCSFIFGPLLVVFVHAWFPSFFISAATIGGGLGSLYLTWPLVVIAGLPAWWGVGWLYRWLEKSKGKDLNEMLVEIRNMWKSAEDSK